MTLRPPARALAAAAAAFLAAALLAAPASAQDIELPRPVEDVPAFVLDASLTGEGHVVLSWEIVEGATRYSVYVNTEHEAEPTWTSVPGEATVDEAAGVARFVDASPPAPGPVREDVTYAVLAHGPDDAPIAQGRVATDTRLTGIPVPGGEEGEPVPPAVPVAWLGVLAVLLIVVLIVAAMVAASRRGHRRRRHLGR